MSGEGCGWRLSALRGQQVGKLVMFNIPPGKEPWAAGDGTGKGQGRGLA